MCLTTHTQSTFNTDGNDTTDSSKSGWMSTTRHTQQPQPYTRLDTFQYIIKKRTKYQLQN